MREIKFRAWNRQLDVMVKDAIKIGELGVHAPTMLQPNVVARADEYEIMQYTGLKDKNGVEIYEGDIVREYDTDSDKSWVSEVVWSFSYKPGFDVPNQLAQQIEVIGNIYENPELLK